ncbi:MAG: phosphoribosylformylglycinamidine synthase subunit PurS [Egibacteraceae bacterium]
MARVHIAVMLKDEILDPQGQAIERALPSLGVTDVRAVRVGKHIVVDLADGDDLDERVGDMAHRLLANPVIEEFTFRVEA